MPAVLPIAACRFSALKIPTEIFAASCLSALATGAPCLRITWVEAAITPVMPSISSRRDSQALKPMFMMGCGGDANPYPRVNSLDLAEHHGRELAEEVGRVLGPNHSRSV